ncbi:MAG TPA: lipid A biosynthesis acyltransferase [Myxococcales bacterium]|nr:lipid A biosynthesis acyltransferase [Myxococcales bacterium]
MSVPLRKRVRRELRVRALFLALPLLRVLPLRAGAALGRLAWYLVPRQRRLAEEHLAIAFPEKSEKERARIGRESFANLALSALESARADRMQIERAVELLPGDEALLRKAHAEGKGVVVVTGHIGAWELFARRIAALGLPCGTVAKEAHDARITRFLDENRRHAGVRVFWRGAPLSARDLLRFLRDQRGILGVLIDQDTRVAGHFVPFFGRPAFTPRAAGDLAAHLGAPLLVGCAHRLARGMHRIALRAIEVERTGHRDADSLALTAAATRALESEIRANPAEWVWMHPRWRTQIPEIAREK